MHGVQRWLAALCASIALIAPLSSATAQTATPVSPATQAPDPDAWLRDGDRFFVQYGFYTKHRSYSPEHVDHNRLINVEIQSNYDRVWGADKTLFGAAVFKNSFGQPSQWIYWGQQWDINPYVYTKVTAGLLHGYKGKYRDKIPLNKLGVAPGIIPAVGLRYKGVTFEGILLGTNALMFSVGYQF
jgi:hypothetical protein